MAAELVDGYPIKEHRPIRGLYFASKSFQKRALTRTICSNDCGNGSTWQIQIKILDHLIRGIAGTERQSGQLVLGIKHG